VNKGIYKLIAQIKKAIKRNQATRRRRENKEEHILLGIKMKSPHQAPHQVKMKKQTFA